MGSRSSRRLNKIHGEIQLFFKKVLFLQKIVYTIMKKIRFFLPIFLILFSCSSHKNKDYSTLPPELATLSRKIDQSPKNPELYFQRAEYFYQHRQIEEAQNDILQSIKLNPKESKYYVVLSDIYFAQRKTDDTEEALEKAIQLDAKNNEARLKLAELYFHLKMFDLCDKTLDEALKNQNHNPKAHLIRAFSLKDQGDTVGATRMLQLVIDQDPKEIKAFLELGYIFQKKKDPLAITYYQNALLVNPKNTEIRYNLAMMFQELGEIEQAEEEYKKIVEIDPLHKEALHNIGYIYLIFFKKYEEATAFFTKAIEIDPSFVNAICNRAIAFEKLGQYENARQDYLYSRQLNENFEPAIEGLNRLDKIPQK